LGCNCVLHHVFTLLWPFFESVSSCFRKQNWPSITDKKKKEGREMGREGRKEERGREDRGREVGKKDERNGGREGRREGGKEGVRQGGRKEANTVFTSFLACKCTSTKAVKQTLTGTGDCRNSYGMGLGELIQNVVNCSWGEF
jgi:hypothetical protein